MHKTRFCINQLAKCHQRGHRQWTLYFPQKQMVKHLFTHIYIIWRHCKACGILVPQPGSNLCPLQWNGRVLTTGLPGNSPTFIYFSIGSNLQSIATINDEEKKYIYTDILHLRKICYNFWLPSNWTSFCNLGSFASCTPEVVAGHGTHLLL